MTDNVIKYDEWDLTIDPETDERTYVDLEGKPLTGILEGFFFFKANDIRNIDRLKTMMGEQGRSMEDVEVVDGKRVHDWHRDSKKDKQ